MNEREKQQRVEELRRRRDERVKELAREFLLSCVDLDPADAIARRMERA